MDVIRSAYSTQMQFDDAGALVGEVQWYFTQPDAQPLPWPTVFGSGNWASQKDYWPGAGELAQAARPWANGAAPPGPYLGQRFCGPADWWQNGAPSDAPPLPRDADGFPSCCRKRRGAYSAAYADSFDVLHV